MVEYICKVASNVEEAKKLIEVDLNT